jgi:hypothetical protein
MKSIVSMTPKEMIDELWDNLKKRKGTDSEMKLSLRDLTLLRAIKTKL